MEKRSLGYRIKWFLNIYSTQFSAFIALMVLCIILSIFTTGFLTVNNILSVLHQVSYLAIMAVGVTFLITCGCIDLANSATLAMTAAFMGELVVNRGWNPLWAILLSLVMGVGCGLFSSFFITKLNLLPFIVTLSTKFIYRGVASVFTGGYSSVGMPEFIRFLGKGKVFGVIPVSIVIMLAIYIIAYYIQRKTSFGLSMYATGGNPNAAELSGIRINRVKVIAYMINGFLAAVAGMILSGRMNSTTPGMADGVEMDCIAATIVGGTSMKGGEGVLWGTLIGSLLMGVVRNGLNLLGINSFWQSIALGAVVLMSVTMDALRTGKKG